MNAYHAKHFDISYALRKSMYIKPDTVCAYMHYMHTACNPSRRILAALHGMRPLFPSFF